MRDTSHRRASVAKRATRRAVASGDGFEYSRDYVQSLARGLAVLRSVAGDRPSATLAEIAARSGLSRAAARRLVLTLEHLGYVQGAGREFRLTPRVLELGYGFLGARDLTDLAQPWMEQLAHRVNESCSMAVLDGRDIGTVVFPSADVKFFVTASAAERARRRAHEIGAPAGDLPAIQQDIEARDRRDSERTHAPLRPAPDAETVDTTGLTADVVAERLLQRLLERARP